MASFDSLIFLTLLVAISAFMAVPSTVEAGGRGDDDIVNVTGTVPCSLNPTYFRNGSLMGNTFPNATVQLRCGRTNTIEASNTTNANGTFYILLRRDKAVLFYLRAPRNCTAVVTTPLSTCNSTLPTNGTLQSALRLGGIDREDDTKIYTLLANMFQFVNNTI